MTMRIVRSEQINHRGKASRPRVDLNALGELLDRAARGVEMLRMRLQAAGEIPGPQAEDLERALIAALREIRSVRGPLPPACSLSPHPDMTEDEVDHRDS
jgi:hypothetical protein